MLESSLEGEFFRGVRDRGGIAMKIVPLHAGWPDRLIIMPGQHFYLVELKTGTGLRPAQKLWHQRLYQKTGVRVVVLRGRAQVRAWLELL